MRSIQNQIAVFRFLFSASCYSIFSKLGARISSESCQYNIVLIIEYRGARTVLQNRKQLMVDG